MDGALEVLGTEHVRGLPIWADWTLQNSGDIPLELMVGASLLGLLRFNSSPPGRGHSPWAPGSELVKFVTLAPGEKLTLRILLNRHHRFLVAGSHHLDAVGEVRARANGSGSIFPEGSTPAGTQVITVRAATNLEIVDDPGRVRAFAEEMETGVLRGDGGPSPTPSELLAMLDEEWTIPVMARALHALSEPDLKRRLAKALGRHDEEGTMSTLVHALGRSQTREGYDALRRFLRTDASPDLRANARTYLKEER